MSAPARAARRTYFSYDAEAIAFNEAFTRALSEIQKGIASQYLPPENMQRFRHGGAWSSPGNPNSSGGEMQTHSAILETPFDDIVNNDLSALPRSFQRLAEAMHQQFAQMLYSTVGAACDENGNTVNAQAEGSLPEAFLAMIEKIELGVNKDGTVSMPEVHADPQTAARMMAALEAAPQEFVDRFEAVKARKIAEALAGEVARKARFVRYGSQS